jgi:sec-independent protein translocase protein TatA
MFEGLFQPMHLLIIFGIALLVFGPKKLPELGKGIGDGIRGFKKTTTNPPTGPPLAKNRSRPRLNPPRKSAGAGRVVPGNRAS